MNPTSPYILVMGYRQPLIKSLTQLKLPFSLWTDKKLIHPPAQADVVWESPFPSLEEPLHKQLQAMQLPHTPTHVIAATEGAVFPASRTRRYFHARYSKETFLIACADKLAMKLFLRSKGIAMTPFLMGNKERASDHIISELGFPLVIKNRIGSGGRDLIFAHSEPEVAQAMGDHRIYETFIDAPEGSIESFVQGGKILFTNMTEYYKKTLVNCVPANYLPEQQSEILKLNKEVISHLRIEWGVTHLEYYRTARGILFGEIALRPPGGHIMNLIQRSYGFNAWEAMIHLELGRPFAFPPALATSYSAVHIFYPGEGKVKSVIPPVLSHMVRLRLKVKEGDTIGPRHSVSEDVGYVVLNAPTQTDLVEDLKRLEQSPPIVME